MPEIPATGTRRIELHVAFTLRTVQAAPIADTTVRLVVGAAAACRSPTTGLRVATDANGHHECVTTAAVSVRRRKRPTNFWAQLLEARQPTTHLQVAFELEYAGRPWLYETSVDRFPDGTSARLEGLGICQRSSTGAFEPPLHRRRNGWELPAGDGRVLFSPGHEIAELTLAPLGDANLDRWALRLIVVRLPEPVSR